MGTSLVHIIGLDGVDNPVATFFSIGAEKAIELFTQHYGHPPSTGFVVDDRALGSVIYLEISEDDIENGSVLVARKDSVVYS
jgi:hypothetical protein